MIRDGTNFAKPFNRLIEQVPNAMRTNVAKWAVLVYPVMLNSAVKVGERALVVMESALPLLLSSQEEIIRVLIPDLKAVCYLQHEIAL